MTEIEFFTSLFVHDVPACDREIVKRLAVAQLHGSLPPAGSLSAALIACDGSFTLGL